MRRRLGVLALGTALALGTGCSGGDPDPDPVASATPDAAAPSWTPAQEGDEPRLHDYLDALSVALVAQEAPMDQAQARCFSDGLIDVVGLDRVRDVGPPGKLVDRTEGLDFSVLKLTRKEGEAVYDQFEVCGVDVRESVVADVTQGATTRQERCLSRAATGDRVRDHYVTLMITGQKARRGQGRNTDDSPLMRAMLKCVR